MTDDKERGLYRRYSVSRLDDVMGKHNDCLFFVLDLDHDPFALPAIKKYIEVCEDEYPILAADLTIALIHRADEAIPDDGHKHKYELKLGSTSKIVVKDLHVYAECSCGSELTSEEIEEILNKFMN